MPAALHGLDMSAYFGPSAPNKGPDFVHAFQKIWGNFITKNDPSIPLSIAFPPIDNATLSIDTSDDLFFYWPPYTSSQSMQINLNQTGGQPFSVEGLTFQGWSTNVLQYKNPGLRNDFSLVDARTWEGGRGMRCDFWRSMGVLVPQ